LYGLEKFWAFLKYSKQKPKVNAKLEEILKNYKCLEDFRVDGASFPQQFYPTKSGIIVTTRFSIETKLSLVSSSFLLNRRFQHPKLLLQPLQKTQVITFRHVQIVLKLDKIIDVQYLNGVRKQANQRCSFNLSFFLWVSVFRFSSSLFKLCMCFICLSSLLLFNLFLCK